MPILLSTLCWMRRFLPTKGQIIVALWFGLAAALSRATFPATKTRLQLAIFLAIAICFEAFRRRLFGQRPGLMGLALNGLSIVIAMSVVKVAFDGSPHWPASVRNIWSAFL
ncbi:hypothetical protein [Sphingobium yanoikuyae]|uniref:hypothetical protein n=1 Tax=Sphingobium yanoikuyae TaxID=13690 RepID=UPI00055AB119|nr:hypothetical protein [Sphingobium yanoikuyae]